MKLFARTPSRDPNRIREGLQELCDELTARLGDQLESIVLYGSFARFGELETEYDSVNLMFVVRDVESRTLDQMSAAVVRAERDIPLTTMTLTWEDLRSSCDVFPIKFHHMQTHHAVLSGDDLLADLQISDEHLRLRCEQQLKNLMLRLRAAYIHHNQSSRQLQATLLEANRSFLQDMEACLFVRTGIVPESADDLSETFGIEFGLDAKVVDEVRELRGSSGVRSVEELKGLFDRLMKLVHDAALAVDRMETQA